MSGQPTDPNAVTTPGQVPQLTPEFAAYIEGALHREIERVQQRHEQIRAEMQAAQSAREQSLRTEFEPREQLYKAQIDSLYAELQAARGSSRRESTVQDGEDIVMQGAPGRPPLLRQSPRPRSPSPTMNASPAPKRVGGSNVPYPLPKRKKIPLNPKPRRRKSSTPTKKPTAQVYRVLNSDLPPDLGGLKKAFYTHIRILWRLERYAVPQVPPTNVLTEFAARFSSEGNLIAAATAGLPLVHVSLVNVSRSFRFGARGTAPPYVLEVEEHILQYMQAYIARYGLTCWCPDLRDTPYSLYNSACRIIALATFKQALVSGTYTFLGPNVKYASDTQLLLKLYDHFVHHYQQKRFKKEEKSPGSVSLSEEQKNAYKNRCRLAKARKKFAKEQGFPKRYIDIVSDIKATSDDEWDPSVRAYVIRWRPERSEAANRFFRRFDEVWKEMTLLTRRWTQRERVWPVNPRDSSFRSLPMMMPLDYFDPDFYNRLLPGVRRKITNQRLAFPADASLILQVPLFAAEAKHDHQLPEENADEVLKRYNIPDEEVEAISAESGDEAEDDSEEDGGVIGQDEDKEVIEQRMRFAQMVDTHI